MSQVSHARVPKSHCTSHPRVLELLGTCPKCPMLECPNHAVLLIPESFFASSTSTTESLFSSLSWGTLATVSGLVVVGSVIHVLYLLSLNRTRNASILCVSSIFCHAYFPLVLHVTLTASWICTPVFYVIARVYSLYNVYTYNILSNGIIIICVCICIYHIIIMIWICICVYLVCTYSIQCM